MLFRSGAVVVAAVIAARQVVAAARQPVIKLAATKRTPELQLQPRQRWHLFLSHVWSSGQDQCATIKRQLTLLLPTSSIFLDVDDLESIDKLEEYVDASAVIMIFVSMGYFKSGNCLREARKTLEVDKPIALMHDSAVYHKSHMSLQAIKQQECPDDLRGPIFNGRDVIEWHRIKDFQMVSLKLLAAEMLLGILGNTSTGPIELFVPGEQPGKRLMLHTNVVIFASPDKIGRAHV